MDRLTKLWCRLSNVVADRGASGVEYGIMLGAVAAVIIVLAYAIGGKVQNAFNTTNSLLP